MATDAIAWRHVDSPVGPLLLAASDDALVAIEFHRNRHPVRRDANWREGDNAVLRNVQHQLDEYFAGTRCSFDVPLAPQGTSFQREVWSTLARIPYGETWSYRDVALSIGKPDAVRAVGAANGRNPIPIVLPCHRVIGSDGALTGFGGGLPTKAFLLRLEGALPREAGDLFAVTGGVGSPSAGASL